jgi:tripartite-type tricarboxylate transporter receptor subunit TctC
MIGKRTLLLSLVLSLAASASLALPSPAPAETYPDKPIKLIVTVAPGGPMDTIARFIGQQMQIKLGQAVVVENRPGAGATLGAKAVAAAEPDGYTLMWGTLSVVAIAPALYKDPGYDPKAFEMVGLVAEFPHVVVVPADLPVKTLADFIAYAKARRGAMNFGGSLGTPPQLLGSLFSKVADLGMAYVPYKGGAPSLADLMSGRLQMQFDALTLLQPLVKEGKLRALAVVTPQRWAQLPDGPTMREAGFADFPSAPWGGIMAPPHTPKPIIDKLNAAINDILHRPEAKQSLSKLNVLLRPGSPQEFSDLVAKETPLWAAMVRESGATAQ